MLSRSQYLALAVAVLALSGLLFYKTPLVGKELPATADFGGVSLRIEYATTTAARERGLGGRATLPEDFGMLFAFTTDDRYGFWMKDTLVPLDMFWIDAQGHVVFIAEGVTPESYPAVFYPPVPARYVLETAAGFARAHGIATGTPLELKKFPSVTE